MNKTYLYSLVFLLSLTRGLSQGCIMDTEVIIQAETNTNILLNLENLLNEDLGVDQGICGIRMVFDHDQLENLRITLTSPAGQTVTLIGPGTVMADFTNLITWNIAFTQCVNPAVPDTGFSGQWNSDQAWQIFGNYMGTYHPFQGCLEDFNMGSANGNWELTIENLGLSTGILYYFELILCNDTGNDCNTCFLDVGSFDENYAIFCHEDGRLSDISDLLEIESVINAEQRFDFILSQNDSILTLNDQLDDLENLEAGIYEICALVSTMLDSTLISSVDSVSTLRQIIDEKLICADITEFCLTIEILEPADETFIDTTFCFGDTLFLRDVMIVNSIDTQFTVFDTISNQPFTIACDSIIHVNAVAVEVEAVLSTNQNFVQCGQSVFLNATASTSSPLPITDYEWTTSGGNLVNEIGPIAEIDQGGVYRLQVSNDLCSDTISLTMTSVDTFGMGLSFPGVNCFYDTLMVNISTTIFPDSINITGPEILSSNDQGFSTVNDGLYQLDVFYGNCLESDSIEILNEATELEIEVSANVIDCNNPQSTIIYSTNAVNPEITFMGPEMIPDNTILPIVSTAGIYTIILIDESGCSHSQSLEIDIDTISPILETNDVSRLCTVESVELPLNILTPYNSIEWSGPTAFFSPELNPEVSEPGIYTVMVFGNNGCAASADLLLTVENVDFPIEMTAGILDCMTDSIELCALSNFIIDSIIWMSDGQMLSNDPCFYVRSEGEYEVTVFNDTGCITEGLTYIPDLSESLDLVINSDANAIDCLHDEITLTAETSSASSNIEYTWLSGNQLISNDNTITIEEEGSYILMAADSVSSCTDTTEIIITSEPDDIGGLALVATQPVCDGDEGSIIFEQVPGNVVFDLFVNNQAQEFNGGLTGLVPGEYQIELLSEQGCKFDSTVIINAGNTVFVDLGDDISTSIGEEVNLNVVLSHPIDQLSVFQWSDPDVLSCIECLDPTVTALDNMVLSLEIADSDGCPAIDELNIIVDKNIDIFVPNVFTPNYDGDNDILTLFISDGIVKIFDIRITDRWGNLVFFHPEITKEVNNFSWDGTFNGENLESGVYVFMAKLLLLDNSETIIVEDITLLR